MQHVEPVPPRFDDVLDASLVATYERDGHVLVRGLLDAGWITALRPAILDAFERRRPPPDAITRPPTAYERAFIQVVNMGMSEPAVRELTWSSKLGAIAARLMGSVGARIFIEDAMFKPPGAGATPWHQDASCLPFEPRRMVTAWIPLVPILENGGRMRFARGSHRLPIQGPHDISEDTDAYFGALIERERIPLDDNPPMSPGDVSFHAGTTIHAAYPNESHAMRELIAVHYFADGARMAPLDNPTRAALANHVAPHLRLGDLAIADAWPLVYPEAPA